ncbi:MAG TPA: HAD-IA family hydrolase [Hyphomicrobiaceae bacterium]|nr:HAD-IA family hydrolase [Hyphomicrobiaceae bacterium]
MQLIIFDCDGTLVDSQHAICAAMAHAFSALTLPVPTRDRVLDIVGLSLPQVFAVLAGDQPDSVQAKLVELYRAGGPGPHAGAARDPLFAGVAELIAALACRDDVVLGIATGKSRRGVARILEREAWSGHFLTIQTADDHPSKPHPAMIVQAMAEVGADASTTIMVGDTSYDMEMAVNAGVRGIGVGWGYHAPARLLQAGARLIIDEAADLMAVIDQPVRAIA